jgi:ubiquinone/menaquinone biosynthesis C-methylase UbiE
LLNKGIGYNGYYKQFYSTRDWRYYRDILALVIKHSEPGPMLDLGAGCGFLVEAAMRWGVPCVGLEGSLEAIDLARVRYPGIDMRHFVLSESLPFPNRSFQTVVMNQVIEHLEQEVACTCLDEAFRVLRPGGMLLVTSPSRFNSREKHADSTHVNMYAPSELRSLLTGRGFHEVIALNTPRELFGASFFGRGIMLALFRLFRWERLSATANCIAYRSVQ